MVAQVRLLRSALVDHPEFGGLPEVRLPFRLRRRRCLVGHETWSVEIDRSVFLTLVGRIDLDDDLP